MNPLDWTGPAFLLFYAAVGAAACAGLYCLNRAREPQMPTSGVPTDAQTVAYLRGGASETLRIAAVTLLERGVLCLGPNDTFRVSDAQALPRDATAVDRAICDYFRAGHNALSLFTDGVLLASARAHAAAALERARLIPDEELRTARLNRLLIAAVVIVGLAGLKILVALDRGLSNIQLLPVLAVVISIAAYRVTMRPRTVAGDRALQYLMHTVEPLRNRTQVTARPDAADVALVAAVFGLTALPHLAYASIQVLQPKEGDGGCGGGCGGDGCGGCGGCG